MLVWGMLHGLYLPVDLRLRNGFHFAMAERIDRWLRSIQMNFVTWDDAVLALVVHRCHSFSLAADGYRKHRSVTQDSADYLDIFAVAQLVMCLLLCICHCRPLVTRHQCFRLVFCNQVDLPCSLMDSILSNMMDCVAIVVVPTVLWFHVERPNVRNAGGR